VEQAQDHRYAPWVDALRRAQYLSQREQGPTRLRDLLAYDRDGR